MPKSNEFGTPWRSPDDDVVECSLTQCNIEHLNKLAMEQCQISASYPRTDTQQAGQRMQQHYQSASTQKVLLNVTQAIKGLQDVHAKLMENSQERGATKKARKQPTGGHMEVETQNRHAARGPDAMKAQAFACKPHGKYTHP